jgi:hypothetical protein
VLKPDSDITQADMNVLALADDLPADKLPGMPAQVNSSYSRARIAQSGWIPTGDSDAKAEVANLRAWAMSSTDEGRAIATAKVLAGEPLEGALLQSLASGGDDVLASLGLNRTDLLNSAGAQLDGTGSLDLPDVLSNLQLTQSLVTGVTGSGHIKVAREDAIRLLQRNIDRIEGRLNDGYSNYPDYAEIGAAVTQARTAVEMQRRLAHASATQVAAEGSVSPATSETINDILTW